MGRKTKADLTADLMAEKAKNQMLTKATESLVLKLSKTKNTKSGIDSEHGAMKELSNFKQPCIQSANITLSMTIEAERCNQIDIQSLAAQIKDRLNGIFPNQNNPVPMETGKQEMPYNLLQQMESVNRISGENICSLRDILDFINQYA